MASGGFSCILETMIRITIGNDDRDVRDVTFPWLRSAVEQLRQSGSPVCVKVSIAVGEIDMILATRDCPAGEGGRPFRGDERKIFELWKARKLDTDQFTARDLEEFLTAIRKL